MKNKLRKIPLIKWLDDFTDTILGQTITTLAVIIALAMIWYWRTLK